MAAARIAETNNITGEHQLVSTLIIMAYCGGGRTLGKYKLYQNIELREESK